MTLLSFLHTSTLPIATQGAAWHAEMAFSDPTSGDPVNFLIAPFSSLVLTSVLVSATGQTLATLNNQGTGNGTITGTDDGRVQWDLSGAVTATLPVTTDFRVAPDPRIQIWRPRRLIVMSFVVSDGTNTWSLFDTSTQLPVCPQIGP